MLAAEIAQLVHGSLEGVDADADFQRLNTLAAANEHEVSFLANKRYVSQLKDSQAGLVMIAKNLRLASLQRPVLRVDDPYLAFALLQQHFHPVVGSKGQRHATAQVHASAKIADDVDLAANVVIGADVVIESGTRIAAGCILADHVHIGQQCILHPRVVIEHGCQLGNRVQVQAGAVIGSDGFGYAWSGSEYVKIPQVGRVCIADDVEIGANACIDRGVLEDTCIDQGVKLDNLVQIGHNVHLGAFTVMAGQSGIAGSANIGRFCQFGGQTAVAGHLNIADACKIAGQSGVANDLETSGTYAGSPAIAHKTWLKASVLFARLPELFQQLKKR